MLGVHGVSIVECVGERWEAGDKVLLSFMLDTHAVPIRGWRWEQPGRGTY